MFEKIKFIGQAILFVRNKHRTNGEVFAEIYKKNLWDEQKRLLGSRSEYYSGRGSDDVYGIEYARIISDFIKKNNIGTIVDLGCGDFRIAIKFTDQCKRYVGVDCVRPLIEHHKKVYADDHVSFKCLDITCDNLPDGELCLIRQVLQHLSNSEIQKVLDSCKKYPFVIVTEHLLNCPSQKANMDKTRGIHTRLFWGSGVYLDKKPFNMEIETIGKIPYNDKSHLKMVLIKNGGQGVEKSSNL